MQIYLVGGAVRDQLLGYPFHEKDWLVVGAEPQQLLDQGYTQVGKDFPVFLHPKTKEEYALARTERKTGPGYTGFDFYAAADISLEQDLARRDLTINAIAQDQHGEYFDPYQGRQDLADKVLRHVSPAFAEDPVRILRTARFAARYAHLGFSIAEPTMALMRAMVEQGEADHLVAERCWKELHGALSEKNPEVFIQALRDCGALQKIMPELDNLFGVPQRKDYHPEIDCGIHSLMVLQQSCQLSDSCLVRFAALVHDLGKATTPADILPRHIGHEKRSLALIKTLCQRLKVPKEYLGLSLKVAEYHSHCHRAFELKPQTLLKMLQALDALRKPSVFEQFLLCCKADSRGRTGYEKIGYPQTDYLQEIFQAAKAIDIADLVQQGYKGAELGKAISTARLAAITDYKKNHQEKHHKGSSND